MEQVYKDNLRRRRTVARIRILLDVMLAVGNAFQFIFRINRR